ncbi:MAG: hypothetical protein JWN03_6147 [Nocardia sp.]|uniref:hypothetical protein n=1 Tax=Nocardia sp. TaxID=1821 RepID=UPI002626F60F|nr:hypothetical protein [Nocardia sp.]MCU1645872.1 hypothetical protein [Nocardia sp.]
MTKVAPGKPPREPEDGKPQRLPIRWALIGTWSAVAVAGAFLLAGPIPAIMAGCAVATAAHRLIA